MPKHAVLAILLVAVVAAMLLTSGQIRGLRAAFPPLSRAMSWLDGVPLPLDMEHVVFFALVAALLRFLLPQVRWWRLLLALSILAIGTELLQFFTIGRTPRLLDARDDLIGACIGLAIATWPLRVFERLRGARHVERLAGAGACARADDDSVLRGSLARCLACGQERASAGLATLHGNAGLDMAVDEGVLVLLHDADPPLPQGVALELRSMAKSEVVAELARGAEARRVLDALAAAQLRVLTLKGTALAYWLYLHPAQRPRADLDLLVSGIDDAERTTRALLALGYELVSGVAAGESAEFEIALEYRSPMGTTHVVDLHWRLLNHALLSRGFEFAELWERSQPIPKLAASARGLDRTHALLHALLHRIANVPHGNHDRLIWLYDIRLLAHGMAASDWSELLEACTDRGIATPALDGLRASVATLGTVVPVHVIETLEKLAMHETWIRLDDVGGSSLDRAHLGALAWPQKIGWLRRKLFPSRAFMRHRYGAQGITGLVSAYLARWWVGLRRGLRN